MTLPLYTSTYEDVDVQKFGADNLVNEFWRVAEYLNAFVDSVEVAEAKVATSQTVSNEETVTPVSIEPSVGSVQQVVIEADVESVVLNFERRAEGDPFRLYITLRFSNKSTTFKVSGPIGDTHVFGVNKEVFTPSQVSTDGYFTALVMATYGTENGLLLNVFSDNPESTAVEQDDVLTVAQI